MGWRMRILNAGLVIAVLCCGHDVMGQSLCGFEMPESIISAADLGISYRHLYNGRTDAVEASSGWLIARVEKLYDSPDFGYTMWANTQLGLENLLATSWTVSASMSYRYYFARDLPLFAYAGVRTDASTDLLQPGSEIRSGLGIGRFRDVTPLVKAHRIVDQLLRAGGLARALPSRDLLRIAEAIAAEETYDSFEAYVTSVSELLGSIAQSDLSSSDVLLIRSQLEDGAGERYCGAILQGGVGYELVDPYKGTQDTLYVLSGDVGRALAPDAQIRCRLSLSGVTWDFLGENTSSLEVLYDAALPEAKAVRAAYSVQRIASPQFEDVTSQRASVEYRLGMGGADLILGVVLTHVSGDDEWSVDVSVSLGVDLL